MMVFIIYVIPTENALASAGHNALIRYVRKLVMMTMMMAVARLNATAMPFAFATV